MRQSVREQELFDGNPLDVARLELVGTDHEQFRPGNVSGNQAKSKGPVRPTFTS